MRLNCNKNELYKLVSLAERSTSKNPTLLTLSSVLLRATKNRLAAISTNLAVGFEGSLSAHIEEDGEVLPPAKTILPILYSIPDGEVTLESKDNNLKITSKTSTSNIKCLAIEEFPTIPKIKKETYFSIPWEVLAKALKNTIPATATTYTKPELASIYVFSQGKSPLTFVATDSFRLAEQKTEVSYPSLSLLLPQKSGQELIKIFEDSPEEIKVVFNKNQILGAVRAAGIFSSRLSEVTLAADEGKGILEVKSASSETGEYHASHPAKISGAPVEANFNYHYLLEAIQSVPSSKVFLGFNGPQKAVLVKGADNSDYVHLVMPMRGM